MKIGNYLTFNMRIENYLTFDMKMFIFNMIIRKYPKNRKLS